MIKVENLCKSYDDVPAVDNISFEVKEGEIIGFLGPNGAGKTTTLRMLTGFMPASSGKALIDGFDTFENPLEVKKRIGYLPEFPPLYVDLSVKDYLSFVADIKGVEKSNKKEYMDFVITKCGLESVLNKKIAFLSKGYKQRVGIAQALVHKPKLLLLDEPTSGLDPIQIIEVRNLIKELGKDHTIMLSSHILPEVAAVCNRHIIINKGKIVAKGSSEDLATRVKGGNRFELKVKYDMEKVYSLISEYDFVSNIEKKENSVMFDVSSNDLISDVIKGAALKDIPILGVIPQTASLEDVFLHLTTKEEM